MRSVYGISSIALLSLLNVTPSFAANKIVEEVTVSNSAQIESIRLAGFLDGINDIVNTGGRVLDRVETERVRQEERDREEERLEAERVRQAAMDAERLAAAEERQLMVEQQL